MSNESNDFKCDKCNYTTNKPSLWLAHIKTQKHQYNTTGYIENKKEKKEYFCECCNIKVNHISNWNIHLNSEKHKRGGKPKSMKCEFCPRIFINHATQKHHKIAVHGTKEERSKEKYYCDICDIIFVSEQYKTKHINGKFHKNRAIALKTIETK